MKLKVSSAASAQGATPTRGRALRLWVAGMLAMLIVVMLVVHAFAYETFTVPSRSMEPAYGPGDRILVKKYGNHVRRGDVIVFSGEGSLYQQGDRSAAASVIDTGAGWLGFRPGERDFIKRVIGVGGDRVRVDSAGVLWVNDRRTAEPYLPRGLKASSFPFSVTVPDGKLLVLGDNRDASDDTRNHLGDPGGGFVPLSRVIGTVETVYWRSR